MSADFRPSTGRTEKVGQKTRWCFGPAACILRLLRCRFHLPIGSHQHHSLHPSQIVFYCLASVTEPLTTSCIQFTGTLTTSYPTCCISVKGNVHRTLTSFTRGRSTPYATAQFGLHSAATVSLFIFRPFWRSRLCAIRTPSRRQSSGACVNVFVRATRMDVCSR